MNKFTEAYITCALWSSTDESRGDGGDPLDKNYTADDIAPETLQKMQSDCEKFQDMFRHMWSDDSRAGHDFWLSRNGHGAGFFDAYKGVPYSDENAELLQNAAKEYGEVNLMVGNDGRIYA